MIKFTLKCTEDHQFDSWFQSSDAFDKLDAAGMLSCAICGTADVSKTLMAPKVRTARDRSQRPEDGALTGPMNAAEQALAEMRKEVEANSEYVGLNFASEARDIHDGIAPDRAIYGEAKPEDAKKLIEDGVPVAPLPFRPGRKSN